MKKILPTLLSTLLILGSLTGAGLAQTVDKEPKLQSLEMQKIKNEKQSGKFKTHKKFPGAHKKLDYRYKDILLEELLKYEENHPNATIDEINEYFVKLTEKYNRKNSNEQSVTIKTPVSAAAVDSYFYNVVEGMVDLNPLEEELYDENPSFGFRALVAGDEAASFTEYKFGFNGHNDYTDAFRHAAWNIWIIGFTDSYSWAYDWTTAHEDGATNQPSYEKEMDLWNNREGRLKADDEGIGTDSSVTTTRNAIIELYKSGDLKKLNSKNQPVLFIGRDSDFVN